MDTASIICADRQLFASVSIDSFEYSMHKARNIYIATSMKTFLMIHDQLPDRYAFVCIMHEQYITVLTFAALKMEYSI